jgi:hypothetical protein
LQIYNTTVTTWLSLVGGVDNFSLQNIFIATYGILKGKTYQFRYRAWNVNGAGLFSNVAYLTAA